MLTAPRPSVGLSGWFAGLRRRLGDDAGFGLVEVLISAILVVVFATTTLALIDRTDQASADSRSRATASNLAHAALNSMREMTFSSLQDYSATSTSHQGALPYQVVSRADWTTDSNQPLNCSSTGAAAPYLRISATVTWPGMGKIAPVTASSLVSPRASDVTYGAGSLVVTIHDAAGLPVQDVAVTAQGNTINTNSSGCAIFHFLVAGSTNVTWSKSGYVDVGGNAVGTQQVSIVNGQVATITPSYDQPATITANFAQDASGNPASSYFSAQLTTGGTVYQTLPATPSTTWATGRRASFTQSGLFPVKAGYGVYAGDCDGNDPTTYVSDFATTHPGAFVAPVPGGTHSGIAYLGTATFRVTGLTSGQAVRLVLRPAAGVAEMANCTTVITVPGTLNSSKVWGPFALDLPYGVWTVCADNNLAPNNNNSRRFVSPTNLTNVPSGTKVNGALSNNTSTLQDLTFPSSNTPTSNRGYC